MVFATGGSLGSPDGSMWPVSGKDNVLHSVYDKVHNGTRLGLEDGLAGVGMQNAGLGSVLALAHLGESGAVPSAFYTVLCVVTSAAALPLLRTR